MSTAQGGKGGDVDELVAKVIDGTHTRANVRAVIAQLEEHGARGVPIPEDLAKALPDIAARLMASNSERIVAAGAKLVLAALKHNLELNVHADKIARLDAGQATERREIQLYGREAPIEAV